MGSGARRGIWCDTPCANPRGEDSQMAKKKSKKKDKKKKKK
jgi:hypothetical protein